MPNEMGSALNMACQMFLYPIAKFLLAHGMKFNEFVEVARLAFVQAAADSEESVSAIASVTGITRKDVARLKEQPRLDANGLVEKIGVPAVVLSHWHQDEDYVQQDGTPKAIRRTGRFGFDQLIAKIDIKLDPGQVLHDLQDSGALSVLRNGLLQPRMRYFVAQKNDARRILRYGLRLRDLAFTLHRNYAESSDLFEASAYKSHVSGRTLPVIRRMAREHGLAVLRAFDDWLAMQTDRSQGERSRIGVGFYLFEETDESTLAT
ncbi:MAG: hypothetical protein KJO82_12965 [Gammaproteobacteria bacterium]|nr:hypothetical protein [Gammaproteobacteria bacterium]